MGKTMKNLYKSIIILSLCAATLMLFADNRILDKPTDTKEFLLSIKADREGDFVKAAKIARSLADKGCVNSAYNLGVYYFYGTGVTQDYIESFKYFKLAADAGHTDAQFNLGELYYLGLGTIKSYRESAKLTKILADKNDVDGLVHLAILYKKGIGGYPKDINKAIEYLILASNQNYAIADYNLGKLYEEGLGVKQDYSEAARFYRLASDKNYSKAQEKLALFYLKGFGVKENKRESEKLFKLSQLNKQKWPTKLIRGVVSASDEC